MQMENQNMERAPMENICPTAPLPSAPSAPTPSAPSAPSLSPTDNNGLYPYLGDYMGLQLNANDVARNNHNAVMTRECVG